jgi:hypothetical protein
MKIVVEVEWDRPEEQAWLCADNIALAIRAYCFSSNTKIDVREVRDVTAVAPGTPLERIAAALEKQVAAGEEMVQLNRMAFDAAREEARVNQATNDRAMERMLAAQERVATAFPPEDRPCPVLEIVKPPTGG